MSNNKQIQTFESIEGFEQANRMAVAIVKSGMVPTAYQNNPGAAIIALDLSNRIGMSPIMVMQNLDIIHGKPAWSSKFLAGLIIASKRFGSLRYDIQVNGEAVFNGKKIVNKTCRAWAKDLSDGSIVQGPEVSVQTAISEGWYGKSGSKWPNMTELMLCYRAAAFFARLYVSDLSCGLQTIDEVNDTHDELNTIESVVIQSLPKQEPKQESVAEVQVETPVGTPTSPKETKATRKTKPKEEPVVVEIEPEPDIEPNDFDGLFGGK